MTCGVICPVDPRVLVSVLENREPLSGGVPDLILPTPDDRLIRMVLDEDGVAGRLAELGQDPRLALATYRAALDHGMMGPVPGRSAAPPTN
jgi:hypothetical protein